MNGTKEDQIVLFLPKVDNYIMKNTMLNTMTRYEWKKIINVSIFKMYSPTLHHKNTLKNQMAQYSFFLTFFWTRSH